MKLIKDQKIQKRILIKHTKKLKLAQKGKTIKNLKSAQMT